MIPGAAAGSVEQAYFNATVGGGSVNSVLGSINVYRLGSGARFRLGYDHEGLDGFNLNDPGTGFFSQENRLEGWLQAGDEGGFTIEVEGAYDDRRIGLQRQPVYYSSDMRALVGSVTAGYAWSPQSSVVGRLYAADQRRVLAAVQSTTRSPRATYRRLNPSVEGRLEWPRLRLEAVGDYDGRFAADDGVDGASSIGLTVAVEGVPFDGLTLGARGATRYRFGDAPYFPVEGAIEYRGRERWEVEVAGGYRVREVDVPAVWESYPVASFAAARSALPAVQEFFVLGRLGVTVVPGVVSLSARVDWIDAENRAVVGAYQSDAALPQFYPIDIAPFESLDTRTDVTVSVAEGVDFRLGWTGRLSDRALGVPSHAVDAVVAGEVGLFRGEASIAVPIDGGAAVPIVGTEVRFELTPDVELRLFGSDLVGPIEDAGRTPRGLAPSEGDPFVDRGFEVGATLRVSF